MNLCHVSIIEPLALFGFYLNVFLSEQVKTGFIILLLPKLVCNLRPVNVLPHYT